jgi:hypothetical protein
MWNYEGGAVGGKIRAAGRKGNKRRKPIQTCLCTIRFDKAASGFCLIIKGIEVFGCDNGVSKAFFQGRVFSR